MRKILPATLVLLMLVTAECPTASGQVNDGQAVAAPISSTEIKKRSEPDGKGAGDYMQDMIYAAAIGDEEALYDATEGWNRKTSESGLTHDVLSISEFLDNFYTYSGFDLDRDYLYDMTQFAVNGDLSNGRKAAAEWATKQDAILDESPRIDFDDLYLLAKIIQNEAGSSWLSMEWKMSVGEVLLNRVASPEFPDTIYECAHQKGQYSGANSSKFERMNPSEDCVVAALRLLSGERVLNEPSVVFQSNFKQGSGVFRILTDSRLGKTYLCYSSHRNLYD
jgi:hypothetical protein